MPSTIYLIPGLSKDAQWYCNLPAPSFAILSQAFRLMIFFYAITKNSSS